MLPPPTWQQVVERIAASAELAGAADRIRRVIERAGDAGRWTWEGPDFRWDVREATRIMGVLNVTPDSFSDGGRYVEPEAALERALSMTEEGADAIDVGGESTRPGAEEVSEEEELRRVLPVVDLLADWLTIPISIDTTKPKVAREALAAGARVVNDVSGLRNGPGVAEAAAETGAALVVMHMRGRPRTMQRDPVYRDLVSQVYSRLEWAVDRAVEAGVDRRRVCVDPGIGFGKTVRHNLELLWRTPELLGIGRPVLVGTSRKSFLGKLLGDAPPGDRVEGTLASSVASMLRGAGIVRVHDVKAMKRAVTVADAVRGRGVVGVHAGD
jgi:dihydropteroate synthase